MEKIPLPKDNSLYERDFASQHRHTKDEKAKLSTKQSNLAPLIDYPTEIGEQIDFQETTLEKLEQLKSVSRDSSDEITEAYSYQERGDILYKEALNEKQPNKFSGSKYEKAEECYFKAYELFLKASNKNYKGALTISHQIYKDRLSEIEKIKAKLNRNYSLSEIWAKACEDERISNSKDFAKEKISWHEALKETNLNKKRLKKSRNLNKTDENSLLEELTNKSSIEKKVVPIESSSLSKTLILNNPLKGHSQDKINRPLFISTSIHENIPKGISSAPSRLQTTPKNIPANSSREKELLDSQSKIIAPSKLEISDDHTSKIKSISSLKNSEKKNQRRKKTRTISFSSGDNKIKTDSQQKKLEKITSRYRSTTHSRFQHNKTEKQDGPIFNSIKPQKEEISEKNSVQKDNKRSLSMSNIRKANSTQKDGQRPSSMGRVFFENSIKKNDLIPIRNLRGSKSKFYDMPEYLLSKNDFITEPNLIRKNDSIKIKDNMKTLTSKSENKILKGTDSIKNEDNSRFQFLQSEHPKDKKIKKSKEKKEKKEKRKSKDNK